MPTHNKLNHYFNQISVLFLIGITHNDYKAYKDEEYPLEDDDGLFFSVLTKNHKKLKGADIDAGLMASGRDDNVPIQSQNNSRFDSRLEQRSIPSRMVWKYVKLKKNTMPSLNQTTCWNKHLQISAILFFSNNQSSKIRNDLYVFCFVVVKRHITV